jgi:hypothetical protein
MNAFAEISDCEPVEQADLPPPSTQRQRVPLLQRARCLVLAAFLIAGAGYFVATASLSVVLGIVGGLLALLGLLVAVGFYALDNVP